MSDAVQNWFLLECLRLHKRQMVLIERVAVLGSALVTLSNPVKYQAEVVGIARTALEAA